MIKIAVIPTAGKGTRLYPLTKNINKSLLPFGNKTIIEHLLDQLKNTSIKIVYIIIREEDDFVNQIGYNYNGLKIKYIIQKDFSGLACAVLELKKYIAKEKFLLILCDSIFTHKTISDLLTKSNLEGESLILLQEKTVDLKDYGIAIIKKDGYVEEIIGLNRKNNPSKLIIPGAYILDPIIFEYIENIKIDSTGEKNFNEALNILAFNKKLRYFIDENMYYDVGTMNKYLKSLSEYLYSKK